MSGYSVGGFLILCMLLIVSFRFLFRKRNGIDGIALLSPVAFIVSLFYVAAFGLQWFSIFLLCFSLIVLITNFRALQRFIGKMFVDYYHLPFCIVSAFEGLIAIISIVLLFIFSPEKTIDFSGKINKEIVQIEKKQTLYTGSATRGVFLKSNLFSSTNVILTEYFEHGDEMSFSTDNNPILLYVPDFFSYGIDFEPVLIELAKKGFFILSADLFLSDIQYFDGLSDSYAFRPFAMRMARRKNESDFDKNLYMLIKKKTRELEFMKVFIAQKYGEVPIVLLADKNVAIAGKNIFQEDDIIALDLNGNGGIEYSKPIEVLFRTKEFNVDSVVEYKKKSASEYAEKINLILNERYKKVDENYDIAES